MDRQQEKQFNDCMKVLEGINLAEETTPELEKRFDRAYGKAIIVLMDAYGMNYEQAAKRLFIVCKSSASS